MRLVSRALPMALRVLMIAMLVIVTHPTIGFAQDQASAPRVVNVELVFDPRW